MTGGASVYERVGGQAFFDDLVERFYEGVEGDGVLRPLYPPELGPGKRHLALFLGQYWGGPTTYSDERGHPMLRARHLPFPIASPERDAWLRHMTAAVETSDVDDATKAELLTYFGNAAQHMVNQDEGPLTLRPPR